MSRINKKWNCSRKKSCNRSLKNTRSIRVVSDISTPVCLICPLPLRYLASLSVSASSQAHVIQWSARQCGHEQRTQATQSINQLINCKFAWTPSPALTSITTSNHCNGKANTTRVLDTNTKHKHKLNRASEPINTTINNQRPTIKEWIQSTCPINTMNQ